MQYVIFFLVLAVVLLFAFYSRAEEGKAVAKANGEEIQPGFKAFMGYVEVGHQEIKRKKAEKRDRELASGSVTVGRQDIKSKKAEQLDREMPLGRVTAGRAGMVTFGISGKFLVVKRPLSTKRIPLAKVTHVDTTPLSVIIHTDREAFKIPTTNASDVADLINEAIPEVNVDRLVLS